MSERPEVEMIALVNDKSCLVKFQELFRPSLSLLGIQLQHELF